MKTQLGPFIRTRFHWCGPGILAILICLTGSVDGQTKNDPIQIQPVVKDAIQSQSNQAIVDEINAIRQQLGGGIEKEFEGLQFGNLSKEQLKEDFDQELRRRIANAQSPSTRLGETFVQPKPAEPRESVIAPRSGLVARRDTSVHQPDLAIRPLRSAARRMDEIAAELEEVGLYDEADSAREQALKFWLKARHWENRGQTTHRGQATNRGQTINQPRNR